MNMKNNGKDPHIVLTDKRISMLRDVGFFYGETFANESIVRARAF
jgi:hypothetical protein